MDKEDLKARARKTAKELRIAARDLERSIVMCDYKELEDLLAEFESADETDIAAE